MGIIDRTKLKRSFWHQKDMGTDYKGRKMSQTIRCDEKNKLVPNLISSITVGEGAKGPHLPVIDLDFPCELKPSSTPGHYHLYLDKEISWDDYTRLLNCLREVGIIEEGFYDFSIKRGGSFVRIIPDKYTIMTDDSETLIRSVLDLIRQRKPNVIFNDADIEFIEEVLAKAIE